MIINVKNSKVRNELIKSSSIIGNDLISGDRDHYDLAVMLLYQRYNKDPKMQLKKISTQ